MEIINFTNEDIEIQVDDGFKWIESSLEKLKSESGYYDEETVTLESGETTTVYNEKGHTSLERAILDRLESDKKIDVLFVIPKNIAYLLKNLKPEYNVAYPKPIDQHGLVEIIKP